MAFPYSAGLRIRPPEPMPECVEGETPQQYFARVLEQCSLESATTAENSSGDSSATPFNIGQIQSDLAQALLDINELEESDADQDTAIESITDKRVSGVGTYDAGDTSASVTLPHSGTWRIVGIVPMQQALTSVNVASVSDSSFVLEFGAAGADGSFIWAAIDTSS